MDADSIEKKTETNCLLVLGITTSLILLYRKHHTTAIFYNIVGKTKLKGESKRTSFCPSQNRTCLEPIRKQVLCLNRLWQQSGMRDPVWAVWELLRQWGDWTSEWSYNENGKLRIICGGESAEGAIKYRHTHTMEHCMWSNFKCILDDSRR